MKRKKKTVLLYCMHILFAGHNVQSETEFKFHIFEKYSRIARHKYKFYFILNDAIEKSQEGFHATSAHYSFAAHEINDQFVKNRFNMAYRFYAKVMINFYFFCL